jgi:hypothetical protein
MSYNINHTDLVAYGFKTVDDQTLNTETSLTFVGKNYTGYSKYIAENFLHLLENFASSSMPTNPTVGQLWYDTGGTSDPAQPQLMICDASLNFVPAGTMPISIWRFKVVAR